MKPSKSNLAFLAALGSSILAASSAYAAPLTWNNGASTGNWNTTDSNWTGPTWNNATPDDAIFSTTGIGTVTLTEAITAGSVTFSTAGYTIDTSTFGLTLNTGITANESATIQSGGGGIVLGANNAWSVASTKTLTVSSPISGASFGLTKSGAGTLTLSGPNTYGGDTTLSGGTVVISNANSFGAGDVLVTAGSTINSIFGLTYANAIDVGATLTLKNGIYTSNNSTPGGTATFSGVLSGSNTINIANSFTGNNQTELYFSNTDNTFTGNVVGGAGNLNGADYFRFDSIGDGGNFTFNKAGNRGGVIYSGASAIEFDTRRIAIGTSFTGILNGNGIPQNEFRNNATDAAHTVTFNTNLSVGAIAGDGTFFLGGSNTGNNTFAGTIGNPTSGGNLGIGKWGTGKWILTGSNSFVGDAIIGQGTLSVNMIDVAANNQPLGKGSLIRLGDSASTGTLEFTGSTNSTTDKQITVGKASTTSSHTGGATILNNGTGTLTFSNSTFNAAVSAPTTARTLTLGGGNTGANEIQGKIQNNSSSRAVALTKSGTGTWTLSGASDYTGATTVSAGLLNVTGTLTSAVTVANNAILSGTGTTTGTLALSNGSTIVGTTTGSSFKANTVTATSSVKIAGSNGSGTIGSHTIGVVRYNTGTGPTVANFSTAGYHAGASVANVGGAGGETQLTYTNAARTWDSASSTWDAMTTNAWQEGDLKFGHGDAVTFDDTGTSGGSSRAVTLNSLVTPGSVTFNNTTSTPYTVSGTGNIAGLAGLTKSGDGTVTLSTTNSYTGATAVNAGTLLVSGSIGSSAVTVSNTGTVLASGSTGTIGNTVAVNSGAILAAGGHSAAGTAATVGATTFNNGSIFSWDINADGTSYDKLIAPSLVDGDAAGASVFRIVAADATFADTFWDSNQTWANIFTTNGSNAIANWADLFTSVTVVNSSFTSITPVGGSFSASGNTLTWNYSAIPEPTSALAGLLLTAGLLRRRRA